jgi:hypothetical protein
MEDQILSESSTLEADISIFVIKNVGHWAVMDFFKPILTMKNRNNKDNSKKI